MTPDTHSPLAAPPTFFDAFKARYPDDDACRQRLFEILWPEGWKCPRCGAGEYDYLGKRKLYQCKECRHQTSVTAEIAMLRGSHLPLHKWFWAICAYSQNFAIPAVVLQRELGVSYRTVLKIKLEAKKVIELPFKRREKALFSAISGVEPEQLGKGS